MSTKIITVFSRPRSSLPAPQRYGDDPRSAILSRNFYGPYGKEFAAGEITGDDTPVGLGDGPGFGDGSVEIGDAGILNPDDPFAMDPGKGGKLPSHWALNKAGIVPTMDDLPNTSPYAGDNYDLPQKTGIYIHRTNRNGFAGAAVSVGCLLLTPTSWTKFNTKVSGLESFKVQVVRSDCKLVECNCFFDNLFAARYKRK